MLNIGKKISNVWSQAIAVDDDLCELPLEAVPMN